jgi:preprotein translocase subunit YajC
MPIDPLTIGLFALLAVMIIFMFRNSRKRRRDAEEMQAKLQPGAEVMTQHGIYGTLISIDDEKNEAIIETTPGTRLRVHRQTVARVVDPVLAEEDVIEELDDSSDAPAAETVDETRARLESGTPEYGERVEGEKPKGGSRKKASE